MNALIVLERGLGSRWKAIAIENVADLRAMRRVELVLDRDAEPHDFTGIPGAHDVTVHENTAQLAFDGELGSLLHAVTATYGIVDLASRDADLEEIFLAFYEEQA